MCFEYYFRSKRKFNTFDLPQYPHELTLVMIYVPKFTHCTHVTGTSLKLLNYFNGEEYNYYQYCRYSHFKNPDLQGSLLIFSPNYFPLCRKSPYNPAKL